MSAGEYSKGRPPPRVENYTPIPTNRLNSLTEAVARIDGNVKSVKEDLLPPLTADTKEARDKAREALTKIDDHVVGVEHDHTCAERARQERQDNDLAVLRELPPRVVGLSKFVWALIGILVTGVTSAVGFALVTKAQAATNAARIESQALADQRHDELLRSIQQLREADRREFMTLSRELPRRVVEARAPDEQIEHAAESLPLTPNEERQVKSILRSARRRGGDNVKR
jgi:hypothetical protein